MRGQRVGLSGRAEILMGSLAAAWFLTFVVLLSASDIAPVVTPADRWPQFRGNPQMTGVSATTLPDSPELLWSFPTKEMIEATAAIENGFVYFATLEGRLYCLTLAEGKEVWSFSNPEKDGCKSSPCIAGGVVVYGDEAGVVRAVDKSTGKLRWQQKTEGEIISSATYIEGKVILGSYDEVVYCYEPETGKELWKLRTNGPIHCSPSLAGHHVLIAGCDGFLRLVSVKDGKETKSLELGGNIASTPAVHGDRLYLGTMGNEVVGVDWKKMEKVWTYQNPRRQFPYYASPALAAGFVLIPGRDKTLHALEAATGREKWAYATSARSDSSPVVVGERVFFGGGDGMLHAVDLKTGKKQWTYTAGAEFTASPAVADGRLVIGDVDGTLYCFGAKTR